MKNHSVGAALLVMLAILTACSGSPTEPGGLGRVVPLGREYELRVGETVRLEDSSQVDVTLTRVFNDSRCPVDVVCPAAGAVFLELNASRNQREIHSDIVRFTGTGGPEDRVTLMGYRFAVQRVLPARRSGQEIPQTDYRVFVISSIDRS